MPCRNTWEHMNKARVAEAARGTIQMKCVSASRTSAETELAIFYRKKDGVIVLTLNCTRFGQYVMTLDGLGMYVVRVQQYRAGSSGTRERCLALRSFSEVVCFQNSF